MLTEDYADPSSDLEVGEEAIPEDCGQSLIKDTDHKLANVATTKEYSQRNVVILGKKGAGKATIIDHLIKEAGDDDHPTFERARNDLDSCWRVKSNDSTMLSLYKVDTPYEIIVKKHYSKELETRMKSLHDVNLIMLVFRHGCFTREEKEILETLLSAFTPAAREVCVLVVTGCEDLSETKREQVLDQYKTDADTSKIVENVNEVVFVGFPNLDEVRSELKAVYPQSIEHDQAKLLKLINESHNFVSRENVFQPREAIARRFRPTYNITSNCVVL